jgi:peptidoglycan hydrolase-like protein with peptidoglycan-binding domain
MAANRYAYFQQEAPKVMAALISRFGLTVEEAAAIAGNLGHESGGFRQMQEIHPVVKGSAGGLGIAQWTGARRRAYTAFCAAHKLDPRTVTAGIAMLIHEMETTEKRALPAVRRPGTLADKVKSFEAAYERAGVKAYASRTNWARIALNAYGDKPVSVPVEPSPSAHDPAPASRSVEDGLAPFEIKAIQKRLAELGLERIVGPADGVIGEKWHAAITAFQYRAGITIDGRYGPETKAALARGFDTPQQKEPIMTLSIDTSRLPAPGKVAAVIGLLGGLGATFGLPELAKAAGAVTPETITAIYQTIGVAGSFVAAIAGLLPSTKAA